MLTRYKPINSNQNRYVHTNNNNNSSSNYPIDTKRGKKKAVSELQIRQPIKNNDLVYGSLDKFHNQPNYRLQKQQQQDEINSRTNSTTTLSTSLSTSSTSSSSESIKTIEEEVDNLNDLLYAIRKRIDNIEMNYSIENLHNCLKHYLKHNGYSNHNINFLENFHKKLTKTTSLMSLTMDKDYDYIKRNTLRNSLSPDTLKSVLDPVRRFFKNLSLLRRIYQIIQRDLIFNVLVKKLPADDGNSETLHHHQQQHQQKKHLDLNYETGRFTLKSRISISNSKNLKRLNKYHQILYELNEKVLLLLNDKENCDLKLLSNQTKLAQKYEFYKCGEYVLRLIPDVICKIKLILKLCQKCYELSDKFNEVLITKPGKLINRNVVVQTNDKLLTKENTKISDYEYINKDEIKFAINKRQQSILNKPVTLPAIKETSTKLKQSQSFKYYTKNTETMHKADSFIRETDSSILSDDSNDNVYENYRVKTPLKVKPKQVARSFSMNHLHDNSILVENYQLERAALPPIASSNSYYSEVDKIDRDELYAEYLRKKDEVSECELLIDELRDNLSNLLNRTERTAAIKDKINSVINVIRETEMEVNNTDDRNRDVKKRLQKELNLLKYRLNLLTQDLDVEEIIKKELNDAIQETNRKLDKAQVYYNELNQQLDKLDREIKILYKEFF
jgi:hypothetical protein